MNHIENDKTHHLTGSFQPQTPLSATPPRSLSPALRPPPNPPSVLIRWIINPSTAFKLLLLPLILYANWEFLAPYLQPGAPNPFKYIFVLSGYIPSSDPGDPRYQKTYWDFAFLAYYIVFFSFFRQLLVLRVSHPLARYFRLKNPAKIDRFGEQTHALIYFSLSGAWGYRVMTQLPSYWYNTSAFWIDYPHWEMPAELKCYYLLQSAYWIQQLLVLVLGLEKPRKDYRELVAHHLVTLWLVGWSYFVNLTVIGNAVFMSMDLPDAFFAFAKLLNYIQWNKAKTVAFVVFIGVWSYFRHYLNLWILWSVIYELPLVPESTKRWSRADGVYMPGWMQSQVFLPLFLLQCLNLFWYYLILRILYKAVVTKTIDDDRSDDEDGDTASQDSKED